MKTIKNRLAVLGALSAMLLVAPLSLADKVELKKDLAELRHATSQFHDVSKAEDAGYVQVSPFVPGMGYHYEKASLVGDGTVSKLTPEALVYDSNDPQQKTRKLVAVEYLISDIDMTIPRADLPVLFPTQTTSDWHYEVLIGDWTLHVWIWLDNPNGVFHPTNPRVELDR